MTYQEHYAVFKVKHWGKSDNQLDWALKDCYDTMENRLNERDSKDPYTIKLWAEVDVIRDLFLLRNKKKKA
jgi:hypothetical protein